MFPLKTHKFGGSNLNNSETYTLLVRDFLWGTPSDLHGQNKSALDSTGETGKASVTHSLTCIMHYSLIKLQG